MASLEPRKYFVLLFMDAVIVTMTVFLIVPVEWNVTFHFLTQEIVLLRVFILSLFILLCLFLFHVYGAYKLLLYKNTKKAFFYSLGLSLNCTFILWFCLEYSLQLRLHFHVGFGFFCFLFVYILFSRKLLIVNDAPGASRILFVGMDSAVQEVAHLIETKAKKKYDVMGIFSEKPENQPLPHDLRVFCAKDNVEELFKNTDIFVFSLNLSSPEVLIKKIQSIRFDPDDHFVVYNLPTFYKELAGKIPIFTGNVEWLSYVKELLTMQKERDLIIKRIVDIFLSLLGILFLLPLFFIIAVFIKTSSKGPILFRQKRFGLNGVPFEMFKFRTMVEGAETIKGLDAVTEEKDERIIPFGKILRVTHGDELPQLVNILKGEMSLIGPRPHNMHLEQKFINDFPEYTLRYLMKPGLTGWAQVSHFDSRTYEGKLERCQYDLYYIRHFSLFLDFVIFLKTIKIMLLGRGAR